MENTVNLKSSIAWSDFKLNSDGMVPVIVQDYRTDEVLMLAYMNRESMQKTFDNPFIIAIDASLGKEDHIGMMTLGSGPLKPGLGVKKKLPEVGDLHITGIVNSSHDMESSTLQTTRLSIIFQIADAIVLALRTFNDDYYIQQEPELSYLLSQTS